LALACLVLAAPGARAATRTWTGGGTDDYWNTAANWKNNNKPGDEIAFTNESVARLANENDMPLALNNINIIAQAGLGADVTVSGGSFTLNVNGIDNYSNPPSP
jgi:hypothetical protein